MARTVASAFLLMALIATPALAQDYCSTFSKCLSSNGMPSFPSPSMEGTAYTSMSVTIADSSHLNLNLKGSTCTDVIPLATSCSQNVATLSAGNCAGTCGSGGNTCDPLANTIATGAQMGWTMQLGVSANGQDLVATTLDGNVTFPGCAKLSSRITAPRVALIAAGVAAGAAVVAMV